MSKSILVIDTPESCCQCRFSGADGDYCCLKESMVSDSNIISEEEYLDKKPDWCPLKDMPKKKEVRNFCLGERDFRQQGYQQGWNTCIEQILWRK